jgi:hypothetical protein
LGIKGPQDVAKMGIAAYNAVKNKLFRSSTKLLSFAPMLKFHNQKIVHYLLLIYCQKVDR